MSDPRDDQEAPRTEGVRIIGAEEAAAALESGGSARRHGDEDEGEEEREESRRGRDRPRFRHSRAARDEAEGREPDEPTERDDGSLTPTPPAGIPELPHWTEPATGEVPKILEGAAPEEDDLEAWSAFTRSAPRWRDQRADWVEPDFDDVSALAEETRVGALDERVTADPFSFEDTEVTRPPPDAPVRREAPPPVPARPRNPERDLVTAVGTGLGFAAVALLAFRAGPVPTMGLAVAVVALSAMELFDVFRRAGHRPATLLGLTATVSVMLAAYSRGEGAIPLVFVLTAVCSLLWFLFGVARGRPTVNVALTVFGFVWIGFLGSFAALLLRLPDRRGIAFLIGAALATVAYDVGGFFVGSRSGRTPLAPSISPGKTWEGLLGGMGASVLVSVVITRAIHPWDLGSAFALGLVVAVVAPLGDLCQSLIKRDLGVKDMGAVLPGHGGMLDRFDALLFALPATYYLVQLVELV